MNTTAHARVMSTSLDSFSQMVTNVGRRIGRRIRRMSRPSSASSVRVLGNAEPIVLPEKVARRYTEAPKIPVGEPLSIPKRDHPIWQLKGWEKSGSGNEYRGLYRVGDSIWEGIIDSPYDGRYKAYIKNPPMDAIGRTTYHHCFFATSSYAGYGEVHFHTTPRDVSQTIDMVENVIALALSQRSWLLSYSRS